jgi:hypothetical protein
MSSESITHVFVCLLNDVLSTAQDTYRTSITNKASGWTTRDKFPGGAVIFLFATALTPARGSHSLLYNRYRDPFLGGKATGASY